ncbi:uncharacterized protein LOC105286010 isoform X3 [Ooceraea biroi]|uniref:uncharacterized protein LOC105286010 isoform X3 n=1 Tax=Ooceraea biroi TaxID=2015173 RepID=UPI0005BA3FB1|nr:uncharacterized protein LOC105286010 isoform X3 [Ooceraea biroi]
MDNVNEQTSLVDRGRVAMSTKLAYALGHIFNDLAAAMWFSYTLIYLQRVASLEPIIAGSFLLLGQVIDAIMTPVFGFLVDRYCKKKIWHVIGSIMVTFSFPVIFGGFAKSSSGIVMLLYVTSITIFQTGWAAVQISHLSMIPSLTNSLLARADLTAISESLGANAALGRREEGRGGGRIVGAFVQSSAVVARHHGPAASRDALCGEQIVHHPGDGVLTAVHRREQGRWQASPGQRTFGVIRILVRSRSAAQAHQQGMRYEGLLFPGRCNRHPGRRRYGVDRKQHDSRVRYRCVNRRGKFHHDGHRVKRHRGTNRLEDGTQRTRVLYRYFSRQDHHRPRGDINREMEMQRPGTLSELQPRRTVRRVRFLDDTGTRNFAVCIALPDMTRFTFSALCNNHVIYSLIKNCRQSNKHISFPLCMLLLFIPFFFPVRSKCTIDLFSFFFY